MMQTARKQATAATVVFPMNVFLLTQLRHHDPTPRLDDDKKFIAERISA
jgi:hypothetical protein